MHSRRLLAIVSAALLAGLFVADAALANKERERRERDDKDRGGPEETTTVRSIGIDSDGDQILLTSVVLVAGTGDVLGLLTEVGVERADEDRVDLGALPLVGGLFGGDGDDDDAPATPVRVGTAYYAGRTLGIDLSGGLPVQTASQTEVERHAASDMIEEHIAAGSAAADGLIIHVDGTPIRLDTFRVLHGNYSYTIPADSFVSIGGLMQEDGGERGAIPVLGDIPLIGYLFDSEAGSAYVDRKSLVVLIKPSILDGDYED